MIENGSNQVAKTYSCWSISQPRTVFKLQMLKYPG